MKYNITEVLNKQIDADSKEQACALYAGHGGELTVEEIPEITIHLDEFVKLFQNMQNELAGQNKKNEELKQKLTVIEAGKWDDIKQYLYTEIMPLMRYVNKKYLKMWNNIYIIHEGNDKYEQIRITEIQNASKSILDKYNYGRSEWIYYDDVTHDSNYYIGGLKTTIVRNWNVIKPELEINLVKELKEQSEIQMQQAVMEHVKLSKALA